MKIGVTGGSGFLGQWIVDELKRRGHSTLVADHLVRSNVGAADEVILADVRDETSMFELAAHVDGIIHLAAVLGTQETIQNPIPSAETNIIGSLNVFEAANRYGIPVVYAGVGNHWMRNHGAGSYTISKTAAEDYARMFNAYRNGKISIIRPVNAYGPRQSVAAPYGSSRVRKIMPAMICRALTGAPIEVYGDGTQISDCVYVADVARIFVRTMERFVKGELVTPLTLEVGPDHSCTVNEIAEMVIGACALVTNRSVDIKHLPMRPGEIPNAVVSADTKMLAMLGADYMPDTFTQIVTGIGMTTSYFAQEWLPGYLDQL